MINVGDVVADPEMQDPEPWTVLRSTGSWVSGGFSSVTTPLIAWGPNRQASNREIAMLPEADRIGSIRAFYWTQPIYLTRGTAPVPSVHIEVPVGAIPGTVYTLSQEPPGGVITLYLNGKLLVANAEYTVSGVTITLATAAQAGDRLWAQWCVTALAASDASDIIVHTGQQYRVLQVYRTSGSGYWKALATRMSAA